jgi:hypothetical protein
VGAVYTLGAVSDNSPVKAADIAQATSRDHVLYKQGVATCKCMSGWAEKCTDEDIKPYHSKAIYFLLHVTRWSLDTASEIAHQRSRDPQTADTQCRSRVLNYQGPSLHPCRCKCWNCCLWTQDRLQWLVICYQSEFATVQVLMELFHSKHDGECLLFNVSIVIFTCVECSGCKRNWTVLSVVHHVTDYSPKAVTRCITY